MKQLSPVQKICILLISIGILLRCSYYLANPSLHNDEGWVAIYAKTLSFGQIVNPKGIFKSTPFGPTGFMFFEKCAINALGFHEYALRLLPLLSSLAGLLLFYRLLKIFASPWGMPIALALFTFSEKLIYYSSEAKQYSSDVLATVTALSVLPPLLEGEPTRRKLAGACLLGGVLVWLSYPSVFVLAGVGSVFLLQYMSKREYHRLPGYLLVMAFWVGQFLIMYHASTHEISTAVSSFKVWRNYMPGDLFSLKGSAHTLKLILNAFRNPAGFPWPVLASFLFVCGAVHACFRHKKAFFIIIIPFALVLMAAFLKKYVIYERVILFLLPGFYYFIAEGLALFLGQKKRAIKYAGVCLFILLIFPSVQSSGKNLVSPNLKRDIRPAMIVLKDHLLAGDVIYYGTDAQSALRYYLHYYRLDDRVFRVGNLFEKVRDKASRPYTKLLYKYWAVDKNGRLVERADFKSMTKVYFDQANPFPKNQRAWFILSSTKPHLKKYLLPYLDRIGVKKAELHTEGTSLLLYDLSTAP